VRDKALYRRKLAYPILTLVVAGIVYLSSRGMIGTAPPPKPADYEAAAREVMAAVRAGKTIPNAIDPTVDTVFAMMAPEAVRSASGGALTYAVRGPADPRGELPWIQSVEVRAENGATVSLSISILNGRAEVVGVSRGWQGMPEQGVTEQGVTQQGVTEQGATEQGATEQGVPEQGVTEQGVTEQ
jgi:hypothetical protein